MVHESLRKQAPWFYGVIIGLAMKEAITRTLPHLFSHSSVDGHTHEILRLFVFLILSIRFYLGAVDYFDNAYEKLHPNPVAGQPDKNKYTDASFGMDFLSGFFHFILFSALALAIQCDYNSEGASPVSRYLFLQLLLLILLYDILWIAVNVRKSTVELIIKWVILNIINVVIAFVIFLGMWFYYYFYSMSFDFILFEMITLFTVILISAIDIAELIMDKKVIVPYLHWLGNMIKSIPGGRSS